MTLQDITNKLQEVIDGLDLFLQSEQMDTEFIQQQLEDIITQIEEAEEINDDEDDFKTFNEAPYGDD
jgi:hypothetical protein